MSRNRILHTLKIYHKDEYATILSGLVAKQITEWLYLDSAVNSRTNFILTKPKYKHPAFREMVDPAGLMVGKTHKFLIRWHCNNEAEKVNNALMCIQTKAKYPDEFAIISNYRKQAIGQVHRLFGNVGVKKYATGARMGDHELFLTIDLVDV